MIGQGGCCLSPFTSCCDFYISSRVLFVPLESQRHSCPTDICSICAEYEQDSRCVKLHPTSLEYPRIADFSKTRARRCSRIIMQNPYHHFTGQSGERERKTRRAGDIFFLHTLLPIRSLASCALFSSARSKRSEKKPRNGLILLCTSQSRNDPPSQEGARIEGERAN